MEQIKESLRLYIEHRIQPCGFLTSVLSNDLFDAVARADYENAKMLDEIVKYIYNKLPSNSWGSRQIVNNWLNGNEDN